MSAVRGTRAGPPDPSTTVPLRMTRSCIAFPLVADMGVSDQPNTTLTKRSRQDRQAEGMPLLDAGHRATLRQLADEGR
jgi:hypothetical protein